MKTNDEIRRDNLLILSKDLGGVQQLADLLGRSNSQVSQLINGSKDSKTGKQRGMNSDTARTIEEKTGKPRGWMDHEHDSDVGFRVIGVYAAKSKEAVHAAKIIDSMGTASQRDKAVKIVAALAEPEGNGGDTTKHAAQ